MLVYYHRNKIKLSHNNNNFVIGENYSYIYEVDFNA